MSFIIGLNGHFSNVKDISAGGTFSIALKSGKVWGWGYNNNGQLGDNSVSSRITPVSLKGSVKTFCKISAGSDGFTLAIDKNGRAWGWGYNGYGGLGDNSITNRCTPVSVLGAAKTFCQISSGTSGTLAIDKNGRAWAWGYNNFGQLGDNSITSRRTPVSVLGAIKTFCAIDSGFYFSLAVDKNGKAWAWGYNNYGQLGDNSITSRRTPVAVGGAAKTFCNISNGTSHSLGIDKNGRSWAWGYNLYGRLGDNSQTSRRTPVRVLGAAKTFCKISAGDAHSLGIDKNGMVWGWGYNGYGQLGDNSINNRITPISVVGAVKTFCQVSAGTNHSIALDKNGKVWGWGYNSYGQLGDNSAMSKLTPITVLGATKTFCELEGGRNIIGYGNHSVAIDKNGKVWGWGYNNYGQLGDNSINNALTPVSIAGSTKTFCQISGGGWHVAGLDKNGKAWGWGYNNFGQLGDNSITSKRTPVGVLGATKTFCEISAGRQHTVAISASGRLWAWGYNNRGQLGDNSIVSKNTPVSVTGATKTFCYINCGNQYTLGIDKNGKAWGWGYNNYGQLGDNSITSRLTPVAIGGAAKTFCQLQSSRYFSAGIDKNGRVWTWGYNNLGQLGDNTTVSKRTPVSVVGAVKTFCQISTSVEGFAIALDKYGIAWAWGGNTYGQLGDNSKTDKSTPIKVLGAVKTFCKIFCGAINSFAIDKYGRAWSWGDNLYGQLGNNYLPWTPVRVCNI